MKWSLPLIGLSLAVLAGTAIAQPAVQDLENTNWVLAEIGADPVAQDSDSTLNFGDDGSVGGNGGCNSFGGSVEFEGDGALDISEIFSTMMACDALSQEQAFFAALEAATVYEIVDGDLVLSGAAGEVLAVLTPASE